MSTNPVRNFRVANPADSRKPAADLRCYALAALAICAIDTHPRLPTSLNSASYSITSIFSSKTATGAPSWLATFAVLMRPISHC